MRIDHQPRHTNRPLDVAIFGAGIAGLAAAAALHAAGHRCRVHERRAGHLQAGMAFILMPHALQSLRGFNVQVEDQGAALGRYIHRDAQGRVLNSLPMPPGVRCMQRKALLQALLQACPDGTLDTAQGGLERFDFDAQGQVARAWTTTGREVAADLYVAADGIHSRARAELFPGAPSPQARVLEIVGLVEDRACAAWVGRDFNKFHAPGGGTAFGLLPTGGDALVWYLQFDATALPPGGLRGEGALRAFATRRLQGWADPVPRALAASDFARAHLWRPVDADLVPAFHRGNLVLAGDAAHPLLPFSSQGVSSAILDAVALAGALSRGSELPLALQRYSRERRQACLPYVAQGRLLTDRFLAPDARGDCIPIAH